MNEYKVPHEKINEISGFDYTKYLRKDQTRNHYYFLSYRNGLFCKHDLSIDLYAQDLDEEVLNEYKIAENAFSLINLNCYLGFLIKSYMELSSEEPLMHKDSLFFDLEHIKQVKNIISILEGK